MTNSKAYQGLSNAVSTGWDTVSNIAGPTFPALYLDCNGSTPVEPEVLERFQNYMRNPLYWGNSSASHARYNREMLQEARQYLASWAFSSQAAVFFCASATEANNMAIQGLLSYALESGKKHIIATELEHPSVLEPCLYLQRRHGFDLSLVVPEPSGRIAVGAMLEHLRQDTLLLCCIQVNNETGVVQPVAELAEVLLQRGHPAFLHVDAAQGAAHIDESNFPEASLRHPRIDMLCISGHKMYSICGIASLLLKQRPAGPRGQSRTQATSKVAFPPLQPIFYGGAQQGQKQLKGLHSGSIPLALVLSLRDALQLCEEQRKVRWQKNLEFRRHFLELLAPLEPVQNGSAKYVLPHVLNLQLPGINAESALLNLRSLLAASRAAACSSRELGPSRVLSAMGLSAVEQNSSLRFSWWHHSPSFWEQEKQSRLRGGQEGHNFAEYCPEWAAQVLQKLQRLKL